jgi:hypothetical protein
MTISSEAQVDTGEYDGISGAAVPWSERAVTVVLNPKTFVGLMVVATVIPFFIGALTVFDLVGVTWIISFITFLSLIHVPMTVYLLSDRDIRAQMSHRRLLMIGGCVFLITLSMFIFTAFSAALGSQHTEVLYLFAVAGIMWQHWHFGKQNLGVLALSRIATRTGSVAPFERYTVVAGAVCGIAAAYLMVGKAFQATYSPNGNVSLFMTPMDVVSTQFRWFQYLLAAAAIGYTVYNFRRFTPATATLYLLGVSFFLPQFLSIDLPQYFFVFASFVAAHGVQYMVILLYHSFGSIDLLRCSDDRPAPDGGRLSSDLDREVVGRRVMRALRLLSPLFFFALAMAFTINFYTTHGLWSYFEVIWRIANRGMLLHLTAPTVAAMALGLTWGILLCHFWLDSFFWRLKEKVPREWIKSRYSFLFAKPSD